MDTREAEILIKQQEALFRENMHLDNQPSNQGKSVLRNQEFREMDLVAKKLYLLDQAVEKLKENLLLNPLPEVKMIDVSSLFHNLI